MRRRESTAAFFLHLIFILVFVWTIDFPVDILYVKGRPWKYCWYVLYWHLCKRITKNTQACKDVEANEMCTFQKSAPRMPQVWSRCCLSCPVCLISKQPVTDGQQAASHRRAAGTANNRPGSDWRHECGSSSYTLGLVCLFCAEGKASSEKKNTRNT